MNIFIFFFIGDFGMIILLKIIIFYLFYVYNFMICGVEVIINLNVK